MTAKSFNWIPNRCFTPVLRIIFGNIQIKLPEHIERNCIWYQFRISLQILFFDPAIRVNNLHKNILRIDNANESCSFSYHLFQIEEFWREGSRHKDGLLQPQSCTDQPWELYLQSPEWRHQRPRDYQVKKFQRRSGQK